MSRCARWTLRVIGFLVGYYLLPDIVARLWP